MPIEFYPSDNIKHVLENSQTIQQLLQNLIDLDLAKNVKIRGSDIEKILQNINNIRQADDLIDLANIVIFCMTTATDLSLSRLFNFCNSINGLWQLVISKLNSNIELTSAITEHIINWGFVDDWHFLDTINPQDKLAFGGEIIKYGFEKGQFIKLANFYKLNKKLFEEAMTLPKLHNINHLLKTCIDHDFNSGLGIYEFSAFGRLNYQDALIACAAINSQRSSIEYDFAPVVLKLDEVNSFFNFLADTQQVANKNIKFLITGDHWSAGEILIAENLVRIFFVDSYGNDSPSLRFVKDMAKDNFGDRIYFQYNSLRTQWSESSCHIFALDYLRKLCKVANIFAILPEPRLDIFEQEVELPINMLRSAQVTNLQSMVKQHNDYNPNMIIKHKPTPVAIDAAISLFFSDEIRKGKLKPTNRYLEHKLEKLRDKVVKYLSSTDKRMQKNTQNHYTLIGFQQKFLRARNIQNKTPYTV